MGSLLLIVSVVATAQLIDGVLEHGDLSIFDPVVERRVPGLRDSALTVVADLLTYLGSELSIAVFAAVLVLWVGVQWRDRRLASVLVAAMVATAGLIVGVKHLVNRLRPEAWATYGPPDGSPAFPSGHTLGTTVFLGLLAGVVIVRFRQRWVRVLAVGAWLIGSVGVGASRVYLGYHWTTDVLAGLAMGIGVLAVTAIAVEALRLRWTGWTPGARREPEPA
ncbi:phosphatase PAP2 family protein [Phycicoccus sp. HDW14]|uniref:phosphatase PAP2 family protein n=1 Tax=Phycicoccus sp. HDW14 TaxID=2714941 RepID=UPI00140944C6|nr:phosphatase PAP2 family protein [Phycicoccus sp. HDW14]QIM22134.1 phosphatase PAP2 family protein [Phycicoccus sp. HDW14]